LIGKWWLKIPFLRKNIDLNRDRFYSNYTCLLRVLSIMTRKKSQTIRNKALDIFRTHGGVLKTSEALNAGIHPRILYELRDTGQIEQLTKGVYALPGLPGIDQPDFVTVSKKVPSGVICLLSALYFHELTVQIPRWVDVAVRQTYHPPVISHPPVHFHWFSDAVFESGVEQYDLRLDGEGSERGGGWGCGSASGAGDVEGAGDGSGGNNPMRIKIYSPEKSIVDCFRLRQKVGIDVALEALKTYWLRGKADITLLRELAQVSRVLKIMTPYIESVIHDQS
jgi:hypothetical protein